MLGALPATVETSELGGYVTPCFESTVVSLSMLSTYALTLPGIGSNKILP